jgi:hypothetical protein
MPSENKDDWRYISCDTWRIDALQEREGTFEDELIDWIDGYNKPYIEDKGAPEHSLLVWIEEMFDERQAYIMKGYCWDGRSMATIGKELDITRVRVWQIYKEVLGIIRIRCDDDWEKYKLLFIGNRVDGYNGRRRLVIDGRGIADGRDNNNNKDKGDKG